ncbi:MAG: radical SAM protein [Planctomycetes bacterium]|nr:radical SAM protein [Planctomycetota bacterium]
MRLSHDTVLHPPAATRHDKARINGYTMHVDREAPNWFATGAAGTEILERFDGTRRFGQVVADYAAATGHEFAKAWHHVDAIARDGLRQKFLAHEPAAPATYAGRDAHLRDEPLRELWIHTNNSCNLACRHCLVSSGPDGDRGMPTGRVLEVIRDARALGTKRFYFTGGEPFARPDLFELIDGVLADPEADLAILTNGMLLPGARMGELARRDRKRLRLQI